MKNVSLNKNEGGQGISCVTLSRPPANALTQETYRELQACFEEIEECNETQVVIIRGEGKIFCAGNDIAEFMSLAAQSNVDEAELSASTQAVSDCISAIYRCRVPVIAAVHNAAAGAGMAIAAAADIVLATPGAQFSIPEIKVGIIGASGFLSLLVPEKIARRLAYTGGAISAEQIQQYGGVHRIVAETDLMSTAIEEAKLIQTSSPVAVAYFKAAMNKNFDNKLAEQYAEEASYTHRFVKHPHFKEAVNAVKDKRPAKFS